MNSEMSIQTWGGYVQQMLRDCGQAPACPATLSHYYLRGAPPVECWRAVIAARTPPVSGAVH